MNIKTGLTALSMMLPLSNATIKAGAQNITKQVQHVAADSVKFGADFGVGCSSTPFFSMSVAEPVVRGGINLSTHNMKASVKANIGRVAKTIEADLAHPIKTKNEKLGFELGGFYRYQKFNDRNGMTNVILKEELGSSELKRYDGAQTIGLFAQSNYAVNKNLELSARAEAGNLQLLENGGAQKSELIGVADAKNSAFTSNFQLGARYRLHPNYSLTGDVNYSTYHRSAGFNIGALLNF